MDIAAGANAKIGYSVNNKIAAVASRLIVSARLLDQSDGRKLLAFLVCASCCRREHAVKNMADLMNMDARTVLRLTGQQCVSRNIFESISCPNFPEPMKQRN